MAAASGSGSADIVATSSAYGAGGVSSETFSAVPIGDAGAQRTVIVQVNTYTTGVSNGVAPSAVTIGGVSAALLATQVKSGFCYNTTLWYADVPSGATASIAITYPSAPTNTMIGVWAAYGANVPASAIASSSTDYATLSVKFRKNGALLFCGNQLASSTPPSSPPQLNPDFGASSYAGLLSSSGFGATADATFNSAAVPYGGLAILASMPALYAAQKELHFTGAVSAEATSVALKSHKLGTLLVAFCWNNANTTPVTLPSGWTRILAPAGAGGCAALVAYKICTTWPESATGFTNATDVMVMAYSGVDPAATVGAAAYQSGTTSTVTYPALSMAVTDGSSRVVGLAGIKRGTSGITSGPAGVVLRAYPASGASGWQTVGFDSGAGVSAWTAKTVTSGVTAQWFTFSVELKKGY